MLLTSSYGRAFKAIREDEIAAEAMGIRLSTHKQMAFIISSFFTGISGALLAMYLGAITSTTFPIMLTYNILLIIVIGGMGSVTGSIIAAFLVTAAKEWWLRFLDQVDDQPSPATDSWRVLLNGPYQPQINPAAVEALIDVARARFQSLVTSP